MSELEAAWLRLVLHDLAADVERQRKIVSRYREAAPQLRWQQPHSAHSYHLAVFRSPERDKVRAALADQGVASAVHYPLAISQQPAYRHLAHAECPNAEAWAAECVTVPCFPEMTDLEVDQVCAALSAVSR
jgi:dTDP-4-amino-4,6-dideoxygalactose transaminase